MAQPSTLSPQQATAKLFQDIEALHPNLQQPHKGAVDYARMVLQNPGLDHTVCHQAGKVVHIIAQLAEKADHRVTIRGSLGPLAWDNDHLADSQGEHVDFFSRTFTFSVKPDQMEKVLEFKILSEVPGRTPRWSNGNNFTYDLKQYGHIVKIELSGISFS